MAILSHLRIAILATDGFDEFELTEPLRLLRAEGAHVDILSIKEGRIQGYRLQDKTIEVPVDRVLSETVYHDQYDALVLPGGMLNAEALRASSMVQNFVLDFDKAEKPIAAIGHALWVLVSAGIASGRTFTSSPAIQDDLRNAGAHWLDAPAVVDDNVVTSRSSADLTELMHEFIEILEHKPAMISAGTRHVFSRSRIV